MATNFDLQFPDALPIPGYTLQITKQLSNTDPVRVDFKIETNQAIAITALLIYRNLIQRAGRTDPFVFEHAKTSLQDAKKDTRGKLAAFTRFFSPVEAKYDFTEKRLPKELLEPYTISNHLISIDQAIQVKLYAEDPAVKRRELNFDEAKKLLIEHLHRLAPPDSLNEKDRCFVETVKSFEASPPTKQLAPTDEFFRLEARTGRPLQLTNPYYVKRKCDDELADAIATPIMECQTILVSGSRKTGRTSSIIRAFENKPHFQFGIRTEVENNQHVRDGWELLNALRDSLQKNLNNESALSQNADLHCILDDFDWLIIMGREEYFSFYAGMRNLISEYLCSTPRIRFVLVSTSQPTDWTIVTNSTIEINKLITTMDFKKDDIISLGKTYEVEGLGIDSPLGKLLFGNLGGLAQPWHNLFQERITQIQSFVSKFCDERLAKFVELTTHGSPSNKRATMASLIENQHSRLQLESEVLVKTLEGMPRKYDFRNSAFKSWFEDRGVNVRI